MTWTRWQRICGWAAVGSAVAWLTKFVVLLSLDGRPGALRPLTEFVLPTIGSVLGFVAVFGIAIPFVRRQSRVVALTVTAAIGLVVAVVISAAANSIGGWSAVESSGNVVVREQSSTIVSGLLEALVAAWLLLRRLEDEESPERRE
ncbi:MAG: hypothetical protein LC808_20715 [Actinobacteria bacterium]|nr:hypothetical protein [Actinomycetota bacterium]